jgi:hypothetical protein
LNLGTSPRYLNAWKWTPPSKVLASLPCQETIEDCQWNNQYILIVTLSQLLLYSFDHLQLLVTIHHYPSNLNACLCNNLEGNSFLIFPSSTEIGNISLYDISQSRLLNKIQAHQGNISKLTVNTSGTLLATASDTGTIIRIFSLPSGDILYSYRIHHLPLTITSLSFCEKSLFLLVISSNSMISICLVNEKITKDNIFYKDKDGMLENEKTITIEQDDDGFISVFNDGDDDDGGGRGSGGGYPPYGYENDDNRSQPSHRSYYTSETRNYDKSQSQQHRGSSSSSSSSSGSSSFMSNIFNRKNKQKLVDLTLTGIQKVRGYSQEFFTNNSTTTTGEERHSGSFENLDDTDVYQQGRNNPPSTSSTSKLPLHIDKKVIRPLFQAKIPKDFEDFIAVLKYVDTSSPSSGASFLPPAPSLGSLTAAMDDDKISELTDVNDLNLLRTKSTSSFTNAGRPNSLHSPSGDELKLLLLSRTGLFQKYCFL